MEEITKIKLLHLAAFQTGEGKQAFSPFHYGSLEKGLAVGMEVKKIDHYSMSRQYGDQWEGVLMNDIISKFKPHIILITDNMMKIELIKRIKVFYPHICVMFFCNDSRNETWSALFGYGKAADILLINYNEPAQTAEYYRNGVKKIRQWYQAADPDIYFSIHQELDKCQYDISFIGADKIAMEPITVWYDTYCTRHRHYIIYKLNAMNDISLKVVGRWWDPKVIKNWQYFAMYQDANKVMNDSRMTLGIQGAPHINEGFSLRFFQCLMVGRLHLALYCRGIENFFENEKHLVWWRSFDELIKLIRYYKKYPDKAIEIGLQGRELVLEKHTYQVRGKQLLEFYIEWLRENV